MSKHRQPPREMRAPASITAPPPSDDIPPEHRETMSASMTLSPPPKGAWWNNIRRAWFTGPADAPVMVDPQPPAPQVHEWHSVTIGGRTFPPAVKVSA